jgi:hypothetical protein
VDIKETVQVVDEQNNNDEKTVNTTDDPTKVEENHVKKEGEKIKKQRKN